MGRLVTGFALLIVSHVLCAQTADGWQGTYCPISRACLGYPLVVEETQFTWLTCESAPVSKLLETEHEYAFLVDRDAKCDSAGLTIVLRKLEPIGGVILTPGGVSISLFRNLEAYKEKPNGSTMFCAYAPQRPSIDAMYGDTYGAPLCAP